MIDKKFIRTKRFKIILSMLFLIVMIFPFRVISISSYTLIVMDENENTIIGKPVTQRWSDSIFSGKETLLTDNKGYVTFPARYKYTIGILRIVEAVLEFLSMVLSMGHTRSDVFMFISISSDSTYQEAGFGGFYKNDMPPSEIKLEKWKR